MCTRKRKVFSDANTCTIHMKEMHEKQKFQQKFSAIKFLRKKIKTAFNENWVRQVYSQSSFNSKKLFFKAKNATFCYQKGKLSPLDKRLWTVNGQWFNVAILGFLLFRNEQQKATSTDTRLFAFELHYQLKSYYLHSMQKHKAFCQRTAVTQRKALFTSKIKTLRLAQVTLDAVCAKTLN